MECLQPLDLIVFPGHTFIVFDKETSIESLENFGVIKQNLATRIQELLETRTCMEHNHQLDPERYFVIRRWI